MYAKIKLSCAPRVWWDLNNVVEAAISYRSAARPDMTGAQLRFPRAPLTHTPELTCSPLAVPAGVMSAPQRPAGQQCGSVSGNPSTQTSFRVDRRYLLS